MRNTQLTNRLLFCAVWTSLVAGLAHAADETPDEARGLTLTPDQPRAETPSEPESPGGAPLTLPEGLELPAPAETYGRKIELQRVLVRDIRLEGNTLLDGGTVDGIVNAYKGRELSFEDLQNVRYRLTQAYIQRGYVNSGVLIPDQELMDGVVRMEASEGKLDHIRLHGNRYLRSSYLSDRLQDDLNGTLNVNDLERSLRLMQQHPLIAQVNAEVLPGAARGESILDLKVREKKPRTIVVGYNNHRSPSVGEDQLIAMVSHQSLTGNSDPLTVSYGLADGLDDLYAGYGFPLTARDLTLEGYYAQEESDIVEEPFDDLDIISETRTWGVRLSQPVVRSLSQTLTLAVNLESKETDSSLLGQDFNFAPGEVNGGSEISVLRLSTDWSWRGEADAVALRGTVSQGFDWFGATVNGGDLPDSEYTTLLLQSQYAHQLPWWGMQVVARLTGQLASDPLLPVEKLAVGGAQTVRGYRENQLVRDEGLIASLEMRIPVWLDDSGRSRLGLSVAPFVDYGIARDKSIDSLGLAGGSEDIASVGAGLLWDPWEWVSAEVYYGEELRNVENSGDSLQEDGIHVQVLFRWSF